MTFYDPYEGNYEWTRATYNTICVQGSYLKVGIAQGCNLSWKSSQNPVKSNLVGGIVTHNLIESRPIDSKAPGSMGFGFAISQVENWTCTGNVSAANVVYKGSYSESGRGFGEVLTKPGPFIKSQDIEQPSNLSETSAHRNQFQQEFVEVKITGLLRVKQ